MRNPKTLIETLIKDMESRLDEIVKVEGYQEMADGFNQALVMVKEFNGSFDFMIIGGEK